MHLNFSSILKLCSQNLNNTINSQDESAHFNQSILETSSLTFSEISFHGNSQNVELNQIQSYRFIDRLSLSYIFLFYFHYVEGNTGKFQTGILQCEINHQSSCLKRVYFMIFKSLPGYVLLIANITSEHRSLQLHIRIFLNL